MGQMRMLVATGFVAIAGATAFGIGASVSSTPSMMTRDDYEAMKVAVAIESNDVQRACDQERGAERQLCSAENRAREEILLADLEARYRGTFSANRDATLVRVRAKYDVDRSRCFAFAGFKRDNCVVAAHAERARALMAIKSAES